MNQSESKTILDKFEKAVYYEQRSNYSVGMCICCAYRDKVIHKDKGYEEEEYTCAPPKRG